MEFKAIFLLISLISVVKGVPLSSEVEREGRQGILEYPKQLAAVLTGVISESLDRLSKGTTVSPPKVAPAPVAPAAAPQAPAVQSPPVPVKDPAETFAEQFLINNYIGKFEATKATTVAPAPVVPAQIAPVAPPAIPAALIPAAVNPPQPTAPAAPLNEAVKTVQNTNNGGSSSGVGFPTNVDGDISILGIATSEKPPKRGPTLDSNNLESIAFPGGLQTQPKGPSGAVTTEEDDEASTTILSLTTEEEAEETTAEAEAETTAEVDASETTGADVEATTGTDEEEEIDEAEEAREGGFGPPDALSQY